MQLILKYFYFITLFLLFLPAFAFSLSNRTYRVFFIAILTFYGLYILIKKSDLLQNIIRLYRTTTFKYLVFFICGIIFSTFIVCISNITRGINSFVYILQFILLYILPCFLLSALFLNKLISLNKFLKIYFLAMLFIFSFGLIEFFGGRILDIQFINTLQKFLANERHLENIVVPEITRLSSVFAEPGWLGGFIFLNFPILYKCCNTKFKLYKKALLNKTIKKFLVLLAWLNIIFTISPIWLLLCLLQALIIFRKNIVKFLSSKQFLLTLCAFPIIVGLSVFLLLLPNTKIEFSQVIRIINTIQNMLNFENFLLVEPSLGSRIVSYLSLLHVFKEHPLVGVGMNNNYYYTGLVFEKYNLPMTMEIFNKYQKYLSTGYLKCNISALYTLLAETGIVGTIFYYLFIYKSIKYIKVIKNNLYQSLEKNFATGLYLSLYSYLFMTLYDTFLANPYNYFMLGLVPAFHIYYKKICRST